MDLMKMMKQAQELQGKMQQVQEELALLEVEGRSGGGLVVLRLNGKGELRGATIDPSLLNADEGEILEDLLIAAHADAKTKSEAAAQEKMQGVAGDLPLPPGMKLF